MKKFHCRRRVNCYPVKLIGLEKLFIYEKQFCRFNEYEIIIVFNRFARQSDCFLRTCIKYAYIKRPTKAHYGEQRVHKMGVTAKWVETRRCKKCRNAVKKKRGFKQLMVFPLVEIIFFRSRAYWLILATMQCWQMKLNCSAVLLCRTSSSSWHFLPLLYEMTIQVHPARSIVEKGMCIKENIFYQSNWTMLLSTVRSL